MTLIDQMQNLVEDIVVNIKEENLEEQKTYKADYEDENFEIITAYSDKEAYDQAFSYEDEHGYLFNVFEVNDNYDEIREVKVESLLEDKVNKLEEKYLELEEEVFRNPGIHICDIRAKWYKFEEECLKTISREEFENLNIRIAEKLNKKYPYCFDIDLKTYTSTGERDINEYNKLISKLSEHYKVYNSIEDIYCYRIMARNKREMHELKDIFTDFTIENNCYITYVLSRN